MAPTKIARLPTRMGTMVHGVCARRAVLLHALPLALVQMRAAPSAAAAEPRYIDPLFGRLRNRYILLRPGQTTFEAADIVDSNPINKGGNERGLTQLGREQVIASAREMQARGVDSPIIFYDNGARASQTADVLGRELTISRNRMEPEFRWLEARGLGALDGSNLRLASKQLRALDEQGVDSAAEEADDGTPSDSLNEVFVRLRNTVAKVETSYSGDDVVIIGGDATVLSVLAAAACAVDLKEHARFTLPPGGFFDLRELVAEVRAGRYRAADVPPPSDAEVAAARMTLREMGPRLFSETAAGAWVLGPNVRR